MERIRKKNIIFLVIIASIAIASFVLFPRKSFPQYQFNDIGTLGGNFSRANAINNHGCVVGSAETGDKKMHPFYWNPERGMIDIGEFGGEENCTATMITDSGYVVINAGNRSYNTHLFIWNSNTNKVYDMHEEVGKGCNISDINNSCQVVGTYNGNRNFYWDPKNGIIDFDESLSPPEEDIGSPNVFDINEKGQAIGNWYDGGVMNHGFMWDIEKGVKYLHGKDFSATNINNKGQIVGESPPVSDNYFLWEKDKLQKIDVAIHAFKYHGVQMLEDGRVLVYDRPDLVFWTPTSQRRFCIKGLYDWEYNDFGHVVGSYSTVPWHSDGWPGEFLPFVFHPKIGHIDMNELSISGDRFKMIDHVFGINNQGQIVGYAQIDDDVIHAFVMTPIVKE